MKILNSLSVKVNKAVTKSLTIYKNNHRLVSLKYNKFFKKFESDFKEYSYEIIYFLETKKGWYLKIAATIIFFVYIPLEVLYYVFNARHTNMYYNNKMLDKVKNYTKENLEQHPHDVYHEKKILCSYWTNYL